MKKAKLMLSAIAIVGVLGGAFAFKTNKFLTHYIYTGTAASTVVISFDAADANDFAMGPVSYDLPEPGDVATFTVGLLALGTLIARRRRA